MKELLKLTNKHEWLLTGLYKIAIYICWFLFACIFNIYLKDSITDAKLIMIVLSITAVYILRSFLKILYKKNANKNYYNIKHAIEVYYFNKLKDVSYQKLETIDTRDLSNQILKVSYSYTKIIADIFEVIIPSLIGVFIVFIKLLELNRVFGTIVSLALISILTYAYNNLANEELKPTNYNDLLKEYIKKMLIIKKLNIFDYCSKKLDETNENDICILKNNDTINDIKFTNFIFILVGIILLSTFIFIKSPITRLGVIIFYIIMALKLHKLLYKINPAIKNMFSSSKSKIKLDNSLSLSEPLKVNKTWKKIVVKNGLVNYNSTTEDIKIPSFELVRNDHISIMGSKGQGKSTILNILSGIFKLDQGDILFDGHVTNEIVDAFYLSGSSCIFCTTLRENLNFLQEETDEVLIDLINEINLTEWYTSLEHGLDEILSDDISPAILQKINILRAIISKKDIYFFDEPTTNLDSDSEKKVAALLKKYFKDKTYIIISKKTVLTNLCKKNYFIKNHTLLEKEPLL